MDSHLISALQNAAGRNRELLTILHQTDFAPNAHKQNGTYIADLEEQVHKTETEITRLHKITEDERKDHLKYQDSTFKRYLHKMGGSKGQAKFSAKAEKEEREFMEAWQKEREAQESVAEIKRALYQARTEQQRLETEKERFDQAQQELDVLYSSIFSGPTPEIPGEDQLEQSLQNNKHYLDQCQTQLNNDKRAWNSMQTAKASLARANRDMADALQASQIDMFGGGTFADMMERDALSRAQASITQCQRHMTAARKSQPLLPELSAIHIDHGHFVSDILFDNMFSDIAQHDRIKKSAEQARQALLQLDGMVEEQRGRLDSAKVLATQVAGQVDEARLQLQGIRAEAFERFAGGDGQRIHGGQQQQQYGAPPPAFDMVPGMQGPPPAY